MYVASGALFLFPLASEILSSLDTGDWTAPARLAFILLIPISGLLTSRAGRRGGRLSRRGQALLLGLSAGAASLTVLALVAGVSDRVELVILALTVVAGVLVVVSVLWVSHRGTLGVVPTDHRRRDKR